MRKAVDRASELLDLASGFIRYRSNAGPRPRQIFVLGTARSGTHWIGHILKAHPDIHVSIEKRRFFELGKTMALDPSSRERLFPRLARLYQYESARVAPKHFADKSHTNIWIAESLAEEFPDAVFIGVRRSVFATVSSMLRHRGVLQWIRDWKRYPVPNRFLGIERGDEARYDKLPLAAKCAMRWRSHEDRFAELGSTLAERLLVLEYEQMHKEPERALRSLEGAVGLRSPIPMLPIDRGALDRWRTELSDDEVSQIRSVLDGSLAGRPPIQLSRPE